jgi:hypothetical protein
MNTTINEVPESRDNTWIRILFHGLLVGNFKNGGVEVGAYNNTTNHSPKVGIWRRGDCKAEKVYILGSGLSALSKIFLDIDPPRQVGIQRHQDSAITDADFEKYRKVDDSALYGHQHDFRWLLDFEKIHETRLTKKPQYLFPRFYVNTGKIYTLFRSELLSLRRNNTISNFGRLAQVFAVKIDYNESSTAKLKIEGEMDFEFNPLYTYDIVFSNDCHSSGVQDTSAIIDTTLLQKAFEKPRNGYFDIIPRSVPSEDNTIGPEIRWYLNEFRNLNLGPYLFNLYDPMTMISSRIAPCGGAFVNSGDGGLGEI